MLEQAVGRIADSARPKLVILFGSRARGDAASDADVDLLVVERAVPDKYAEILRLRRAVGDIGASVDLLVCSEAEFKRRSRVPGTVLYWARREGKVLYEAAS